MKSFNIDMTPDSHLLRSVVSTNITSPEAISELVDNSFDAGAHDVLVRCDPTAIEVIDDGRGCSDVQSMLALGKHRKHTTTKLGRYGVGMKNAACGMGDMLNIKTTRSEIKRTAEICWSEIEERGWKSASGQEEDAPGAASGTTITISRLRSIPSGKPVRDRLAFNFAPALWSGRSIKVNGSHLEAWVPPILSDELVAEDEHDTLPISFSVKAGLTNINERDPFILAYEHRIIAGTVEPCGRYVTASKFIALVTLRGDWPLLKHKDGLREGMESAWLYERLEAICEDLLRRVHKMSESVELSEIASELEDALNFAIGQAKRPNRNGEDGNHRPAGSNRIVTEAAKVDDEGDVKERLVKSRRRGFSIAYAQLPGGILGKVDVNGKRVCVQLNDSHPFITQCRSEQNRVALKSCAAFLVCEHQANTTDKSQLVFKFEKETRSGRFIELASSMFATMAHRSQREVEVAS